MSFLQTVTGPVETDGLGMIYAHEHIVIERGYVTERYPDFEMDDLEAAAEELRGLHALGVGAMIDSMPTAAGRNAAKLRTISEASGVAIVCPTGVHLSQYYAPNHWTQRLSEDDLLRLFVDEIELGIDGNDHNGPWIERLPIRAGAIKVAGGKDRLSPAETRAFRAAGRAQARTGCPILTHTERGTAAREQVERLEESGADLRKVVLSHLDRNPDVDLHRALLRTGVTLEYDSFFRWKGKENPTRDLILTLAPDFPTGIVLGMDAARRSYWRSYGGSPGLDFLVARFLPDLASRGLSQELIDRIMIDNPAEAYSFGERSAT